MSKLIFQPVPRPPSVYTPAYHATVQRILLQAFARVNYTPVEQNVFTLTQTWMN